MQRIEQLRSQCPFSFTVTSAARCPEYNAKVSTTGRTGPHTTGRAIDIAVRGAQAWEFLRKAMFMGFTGIGVNEKGETRFIHLDDLPNGPGCPRPTVWSY